MSGCLVAQTEVHLDGQGEETSRGFLVVTAFGIIVLSGAADDRWKKRFLELPARHGETPNLDQELAEEFDPFVHGLSRFLRLGDLLNKLARRFGTYLLDPACPQRAPAFAGEGPAD